MTDGRDQFDEDPWGAAVEVPEWRSAQGPEPGPEPVPGLAEVDAPRDGLASASRSTGRRRRRSTELVRLRRFAREPLVPLLVAASALVIVGFAENWRLLLLAAFVAATVTATRLRFSAQAALGLLLVVALLAIGGWGPGLDRRPAAVPAHGAHGTKS